MGWAIREFVSACDICARVRSSTQHSAGDLQRLPVPRHPWSHVNDFVTSICLLTISTPSLPLWIDSTRRYIWSRYLPPPSTKWTVKLFLEHVVWLHGFPKDIISDMGPQFTARFWKASSSLTSGYHPQNRQYRPTNNWDAFVMLHLHLIISLAMLYTFSAQYTKQHRCQHLLDHSFQPQDRVWLSTRHLNRHTESKKLNPMFTGPYEIAARISRVIYRLHFL